MKCVSNGGRWILPAVAVGLGTLVLSRCGNPVHQPGGTLPSTCELDAPIVPPQNTDILFLIDNSSSMQEEQAAGATELPIFLNTLKSGPLQQDFRVAVATTSVYLRGMLADGGLVSVNYAAGGQAGRLQPVPPPGPDGGPPGGERFLSSADPDLLPKFQRLIRVGATGSGQETPFEAARLALTEPLASTDAASGGTRGFLRDGARLLIAVITDEDDCSEDLDDAPAQATIGTDQTVDYCHDQAALLTPVQHYFDTFTNLVDSTGAPREVVWAAIAPVGVTNKDVGPVIFGGQLHNVDCPTSFEPGYRHKEMASLFDSTLGNLDSICSPSFSASLVRIAQIANTSSSVAIMNVPEPALLLAEITRGDDTVQPCTVANGGIRYTPSAEGRDARIYFQGSCARNLDDKNIRVKLLCVG